MVLEHIELGEAVDAWWRRRHDSTHEAFEAVRAHAVGRRIVDSMDNSDVPVIIVVALLFLAAKVVTWGRGEHR